jgi:hypothetical protein
MALRGLRFDSPQGHSHQGNVLFPPPFLSSGWHFEHPSRPMCIHTIVVQDWLIMHMDGCNQDSGRKPVQDLAI